MTKNSEKTRKKRNRQNTYFVDFHGPGTPRKKIQASARPPAVGCTLAVVYKNIQSTRVTRSCVLQTPSRNLHKSLKTVKCAIRTRHHVWRAVSPKRKEPHS